MTLTEQCRKLFYPTARLEVNWRNNLGRMTKFPRSSGDLAIDTDVCFGQGHIGILLLLIQTSGNAIPNQALIGTVEPGDHPREPVIAQRRCPVSEIHPVNGHGGHSHEAGPSRS